MTTTTEAPPDPTVTVLPYQGRVYAGGRKNIRVKPEPRRSMRGARRAKAAPSTAWCEETGHEVVVEPSGPDRPGPPGIVTSMDDHNVDSAFAETGHGHTAFDADKHGAEAGMTGLAVSVLALEIALAKANEARLWHAIQDCLGFARHDIERAYQINGRPGPGVKQIRDRIDARLLALSERGVNMTDVARVLGWSVTRRADGTSDCQTMRRALRRARRK